MSSCPKCQSPHLMYSYTPNGPIYCMTCQYQFQQTDLQSNVEKPFVDPVLDQYMSKNQRVTVSQFPDHVWWP